MKNIKMLKSVLLPLAFVSFLFTGCFNPVFKNIEREVVLEKGTVVGTVNSIVHYSQDGKDYVVTSNGASVFYKEKADVSAENYGAPTAWNKRANDVFTPVAFSYENHGYKKDGRYIVKLAADDKYLYALAFSLKLNDEGENEPESYFLYYTDDITGSDWTCIESAAPYLADPFEKDRSEDRKLIGKLGMFCTNSQNTAQNEAYIRSYSKETKKFTYLKLGTSLTPVSVETVEGKDPETEAVKTALKYGGKTLFFVTGAAIAGEDAYYYVSDKANEILMKKDGAEPKAVYRAGFPIISMAITKDYLMWGCGNPSSTVLHDGGIFHLSLEKIRNAEKSFPSSDSFSTNADSAMTTSYEVRTLLVEDSSQSEEDAVIYSGITFKSSGASLSVSFENKGLWAYYPIRGNWNRE